MRDGGRAPAEGRLPVPIAGAGAALSAVLLAASAPPWDQAWLAWAALAPFFLLFLRDLSTVARFWIGVLHGALFLLALVPWFAAFTPVGYALAAGYWGLQEGALSLLLAAALRRTPRAAAPAILACGWTLLEWVRAQGTLRFPFGMLAASQHDHLRVLQMLDITGAYGLSMLIAAASGVFALLCAGAPAARGWLAGLAGLILALLTRGERLLAEARPEGRTLGVALVQASQSVPYAGAEVRCISPPAEYDRRTLAALSPDIDLVVWPESARTDDVVHDPFTRERTTALIRGTRTHILTGSFIRNPATGRDSNAAALLSPEDQVLGTYRKVWIVPFGEYLPARPLFFWAEAAGWPLPPSDLEPGTLWTPLSGPGFSAGVAICFESAFGSIARTYVRQGADVLAVLTSDGWAGRTAVAYQHAAFAPLRAVETRRSIVRAAATGVSALIDPYGRRVAELPLFDRGHLSGRVELRQDVTPYVRYGDWPVGLAALLPVGLCLRRRSRPGREVRQPPAA